MKTQRDVFTAIRDRDLVALKECIRQGVDYRKPGRNGTYPLLMAAGAGFTAALRIMLESGAPASFASPSGETPLHRAAARNRKAVVQLLLDHGAHKNVRDRDGNTPLHYAAGRGNGGIIRLLITRGAKAGIRNHRGQTLADMAAQGGYRLTIMGRQKAGIECERLREALPLAGGQKEPELPSAASAESVPAGTEPAPAAGEQVPLAAESVPAPAEPVHTAVTQESAPEKPLPAISQYLTLHEAVKWGNADAVRSFLDANAELEKKDENGMTPLNLACCRGFTEIGRMLLSLGARTDTRDNEGATPLHHAAASNRMDLIEYLLDHGAGINALDHGGSTPLHYAAERGNSCILNKLYSRGARSSHINDHGETIGDAAEKGGYLLTFMQSGQTSRLYITIERLMEPEQDNDSPRKTASGAKTYVKIHDAAREGNIDAVRTFLMTGTRISARDKNGATPLSLARYNDHHALVNFLLEHGADGTSRGISPAQSSIRTSPREVKKAVPPPLPPAGKSTAAPAPEPASASPEKSTPTVIMSPAQSAPLEPASESSASGRSMGNFTGIIDIAGSQKNTADVRKPAADYGKSVAESKPAPATCLPMNRDSEKSPEPPPPLPPEHPSPEELECRKWLTRGRALQNQEDHGKAVAYFDRVLAREPDNGEVWCLKGDSLLAQGNTREAGECFARAHRIDATGLAMKGIVRWQLEHQPDDRSAREREDKNAAGTEKPHRDTQSHELYPSHGHGKGSPEGHEIEELLSHSLRSRPVAEKIDTPSLAPQCENFSRADVVQVCVIAAELAFSRELLGTGGTGGAGITEGDLVQAIGQVGRSKR